MTSQSIMIEDTILAMKRTTKKNKADAFSDSDSEPSKPTNRGNKLKRKSKYYHEGQLGGYRPFKRRAEHAGYQRYILHRNPKRYDEEGYELFDDDTDEEADEEAASKNPYSGVKVESLLMPLIQASDLNDHPSLSIPYKSKQLPRMVQEACEMMHRERRTLAEMKLLLAKFRGDPTWIPSGMMLGEDDASLFGTYPQADGTFATVSLDPTVESLVKTERTTFERRTTGQTVQLAVNGGDATASAEPDASAEASAEKRPNGLQNGYAEEIEMVKDGPISPKNANENVSEGTLPVEESNPDAKPTENARDAEAADADMKDVEKPHPTSTDEGLPVEIIKDDGEADAKEDAKEDVKDNAQATNLQQEQESREEENIEMPNADVSKSSNPPTPSALSTPGASPPRMLTRGRANNNNNKSTDQPPSPSATQRVRPQTAPPSPSSTIFPIHPLYLAPSAAMPSRDFGLPPPEAEDSRKILSAWVQKQEEVCRGAERLYEGLLKARRLRDTVWRWCRAEAHAGEMSDGEDWVDGDEWGLEAPLKKGAEDGAEEDGGGGKKTRGRRTAGG